MLDEGVDNIPVQKVIKVAAKEDDVTLDEHLKQLSKSELIKLLKKHKKQFKEEAEVYFLKRIDENLENAGNSNYARIAESISQLKQINQRVANKMLTDIRTSYKRRKNLIQMLNRF